MTGKEFCNLLNIDYESIIDTRKQDAIDNFNYVIEELIKISELKKAINIKNREHILKDDFY